ncbi:MAG: cytochrome c [Deltaproteobacteria bacterium]|nr:cytochrome c [Deltaproteobacteria bacterium]
MIHEGDRVQKGWLQRFLKDPRPIRPMSEGRMPSFRLSEGEAAAIAEYIAAALVDRQQAKGTGAEAVKDGPGVPAGLAARGQKLFEEELGCRTCHRLGGEGARGAPDLTDARDRLDPRWLVRWLKDPKVILPATPMPKVGLSDEEARAVAAYLLNHRARRASK